MNWINFQTAPSIGAVVMLDDQEYELVGAAPYTRRDGQRSTVLTWLSDCPRCGDRFHVTSGLVSKALNRRCEKCAKCARRPVSGKRRSARVAVKVIP